MAITINTALKAVHLSRNQMPVEFDCPDKYTAAGAFAIQRGVFTTFPLSDGNNLTIAWTNEGVAYSRVLTFRTTPDVELIEAPIYPGSGPATWAQVVVDALMGDPVIAQQFMVVRYQLGGDHGFQLYALFESAVAIVLTPTGYTLASTTPTAGAVTGTEINYRLSVWIFLGIATTAEGIQFTRLPEIELDADNAGSAWLDIQRYVDDMMTAWEPPTTSLTPVLCVNTNLPLYLLYGQKWGDTPERQKNFKSAEIRVLKGGLKPRDYAAVKSTLGTHLNGRFMTLRTDREINSKQDDWLTWFCESNSINYRLRITVYMSTGFTFTSTVWTATFSAGRTYQFRADRLAVEPTLPGTGEHAYYELFIDNGTTAVTSKVKFTLVDDYMDVFLEYENGLGAIESWKMRGNQALVHRVSKELYDKPLPYDHAETDGELHSTGERIDELYSVMTGPLNATDAAALGDLLRSRHVWLRNGLKRIPARLSAGDPVVAIKNLEANYERGMELKVELGGY